MFFYEMLLALLLALIVVAVVTPSRRYRGQPGKSLLLFFFPLLFLLIWMTGAWLVPIGAPVAGVYWASFVAAALFLGLLLFALSTQSAPPRRKGDVEPANAEKEAAAGTAVVFGIFFWALVIAAILALFARYL